MKRRKSQVQEVMTSAPIVISPDATLFDAYCVMFDNEIRRLPVVEDDELVGIVTLSDIWQSMSGRLGGVDMETRLKLSARTVRDVMADDPITIASDDTIQEAAERMLEYQISGLPVVEDSHVVGIITETDIFRLIVNGWSQEENEPVSFLR
jgi:acetoin utilization protein AcuB